MPIAPSQAPRGKKPPRGEPPSPHRRMTQVPDDPRRDRWPSARCQCKRSFLRLSLLQAKAGQTERATLGTASIGGPCRNRGTTSFPLLQEVAVVVGVPPITRDRRGRPPASRQTSRHRRAIAPGEARIALALTARWLYAGSPEGVASGFGPTRHGCPQRAVASN